MPIVLGRWRVRLQVWCHGDDDGEYDDDISKRCWLSHNRDARLSYDFDVFYLTDL